MYVSPRLCLTRNVMNVYIITREITVKHSLFTAATQTFTLSADSWNAVAEGSHT